MRFHLGRWLVGFGAFCVVVVILLAYQQEQNWKAMVAARAELKSSINGLPNSRPVLHGDAIEGRAFDEYGLFADGFRSLPNSEFSDVKLTLKDSSAAKDSGASELRDSLLDSHQLTLEALGRGARSIDSRYLLDWKKGIPFDLPNMSQIRSVVNLSIVAAQRHLDDEQPVLAVDSLLDGMQLCRDMMEIPVLVSELVGASLMPLVTGASTADDFLERLPPAELERLAEAMRTLDSGLPLTSYSQEGELLGLATLVMQPGEPNVLFDLEMGLDTWSYGFSPRALYSHHILLSKRDCDHMRELSDAEWIRRRAAIAEIETDMQGSRNALRRKQRMHWTQSESSRRSAIAQLRLALAAAEFKATGRQPAIPDPFGGELRFTEIGDTLRIESGFPVDHPRPELFRVEVAVR